MEKKKTILFFDEFNNSMIPNVKNDKSCAIITEEGIENIAKDIALNTDIGPYFTKKLLK